MSPQATSFQTHLKTLNKAMTNDSTGGIIPNTSGNMERKQ